jgi:hypothetical protein
MLNRLHDDLKLTPAQEAMWRQYDEAMLDSAQTQTRHQSTQRLLPQLQTPRRLALIDATMTQDLADFRRHSQATEAFYDSLNPIQQRAFDRETLPSGGSEQ